MENLKNNPNRNFSLTEIHIHLLFEHLASYGFELYEVWSFFGLETREHLCMLNNTHLDWPQDTLHLINRSVIKYSREKKMEEAISDFITDLSKDEVCRIYDWVFYTALTKYLFPFRDYTKTRLGMKMELGDVYYD